MSKMDYPDFSPSWATKPSWRTKLADRKLGARGDKVAADVVGGMSVLQAANVHGISRAAVQNMLRVRGVKTGYGRGRPRKGLGAGAAPVASKIKASTRSQRP